MSFVAAGVSLAMLAVGTYLNYSNQQDTANRADQVEAQNIQRQTALDKKANQDTQQLLQKDAQSNTDTSQKSALLNAFQKAVAANQGTSTGGLNQVGNVSSAYTKAANDAALGVSQYTNKQAGDLASMDAPNLQRQSENANLAQYGSQIGAIGQQSAGDNAVANIRLQGVRPNPWLSAVAQGLTSYGSSGMGGMMTGGGSSVGNGVSSGAVSSLGNYGANLPINGITY